MFLQKEGFSILKTNWRFQKAEVDIIAQDNNFLVFVEVKTRGSSKFGKPEYAINENKIALYKDATVRYLEQYLIEAKIRFDIVSIIIEKDETDIEYIPNAF